jgi:hypothetical protein
MYGYILPTQSFYQPKSCQATLDSLEKDCQTVTRVHGDILKLETHRIEWYYLILPGISVNQQKSRVAHDNLTQTKGSSDRHFGARWCPKEKPRHHHQRYGSILFFSVHYIQCITHFMKLTFQYFILPSFMISGLVETFIMTIIYSPPVGYGPLPFYYIPRMTLVNILLNLIPTC